MVSHKYGEKILLTAFNGISWLRRRKRSNLKGEMETKKIYVSACVCMLHKTNAKLERRENGFEAFMLSLLQTHTKHNKEIHRFIDFVVVRYEQSRALVSLSLCSSIHVMCVTMCDGTHAIALIYFPMRTTFKLNFRVDLLEL